MSARIVAATLAVAACAGIGAGIAIAHDEVEATSPARGAVLTKLPAKVSVTFGETVGRLNSVVVTRNGKGNLVRRSRIQAANAARVVATLKRPGARWWPGTYKVTWKVTGADGHKQTLTAGFRVTR
jgi:methionine-rich copper-binding protein CopC